MHFLIIYMRGKREPQREIYINMIAIAVIIAIIIVIIIIIIILHVCVLVCYTYVM